MDMGAALEAATEVVAMEAVLMEAVATEAALEAVMEQEKVSKCLLRWVN